MAEKVKQLGDGMTRFSDWQTRLGLYIVDCADRPFRYGQLDCGLFVSGAIEAITGVDVARDLRGRYWSRGEAFTAIKALCGSASMQAIADHLAAQFGISEISVSLARRGDAVQLRRGRKASLGIVSMYGSEILTPYARGLLRLPIAHATRAWRI